MASSSKKSRDTTAGENNRDSLAYNCLLRNELLGASIGAVKGPCDERRAVSSPERKNFFHVSFLTVGENCNQKNKFIIF